MNHIKLTVVYNKNMPEKNIQPNRNHGVNTYRNIFKPLKFSFVKIFNQGFLKD